MIHTFRPVAGLNKVALTQASPADLSSPEARLQLDRELHAQLQACPHLSTALAVATNPNGDTAVISADRPDAVHQSVLDGNYAVVARLSSSLYLKNALSRFPSKRYEIKPFGDHSQEITLPGKLQTGQIEMALREGAQANNYAPLEKLVQGLPAQGRVCILLDGPSASGKSSLIRKLQQFAGDRPVVPVSGDSCFKDIDDDNYPKTQDGSYFFDSLNAMDMERARHDLVDLLRTGHAEQPKYNWTDDRPGGWHHPVTAKGYREEGTVPIDLPENGIAVFDSIHAGDESVIQALQDNQIPFRVIYLDSERAEDRLQRRMIRDEKDRSLEAHSQVRIWQQSVRRGETENVIPSILNLDPTQDAYVRLKFPTDLGLSLEQLEHKTAQFRKWGLLASNQAFTIPDENMGEFAAAEKERFQTILDDPQASPSDKAQARKGLDRLQAAQNAATKVS
jgi:uridine kinase